MKLNRKDFFKSLLGGAVAVSNADKLKGKDIPVVKAVDTKLYNHSNLGSICYSGVYVSCTGSNINWENGKSYQ